MKPGVLVTERLGDSTKGTVLDVHADGSVRVQWDDGRRLVHTADELALVDTPTALRKSRARERRADQFSSVRYLLPRSEDS